MDHEQKFFQMVNNLPNLISKDFSYHWSINMFNNINPLGSNFLGLGRKRLFFRIHKTIDGLPERKDTQSTDIVRITGSKGVG